jgi:tetratricopeptide (TPR) repeat protein
MSGGAPVIVAVDDAHSGDLASLDALTFAFRRLQIEPVLAVLTVREEAVDNLPQGLRRFIDDHGQWVQLSGLDRSGVRDMAAAMAGSELSDRAAERLRVHTMGNPLHLGALLRELPFQVLQSTDQPLPAPRSFASHTGAMYASAPGDLRRLLAAAAVLGERSALHDAASVAELAAPLPVLEAAVGSGLMTATRVNDGWSVAFVHPLVRAAIIEALGPATASRLHLRAAEVLGEPRSLPHRVAAAAGPDPALADELSATAEAQRDAGAVGEAADLLLAAVRLTPAGDDRDARLLDAIELLLLAGEVSEALSMAAQVTALRPTAQRFHVEATLAFFSGARSDAERSARAAWELGADGDPSRRAQIAGTLAQIGILNNDHEATLEWARRAAADPPDSGPWTNVAQTLEAGTLAVLGRPEEALSLLGDLPPDPTQVPPARLDELTIRGAIHMWCDDLSEARLDLSHSTPSADRGLAPYRLTSLAHLADCDYRLGDWSASLAEAQLALSLVQDTEQVWLLAFSHAVAVLVLAGKGRWEEAAQAVEASTQAAAMLGDEASRAHADNARAHLAWCEGTSKLW